MSPKVKIMETLARVGLKCKEGVTMVHPDVNAQIDDTFILACKNLGWRVEIPCDTALKLLCILIGTTTYKLWNPNFIYFVGGFVECSGTEKSFPLMRNNSDETH